MSSRKEGSSVSVRRKSPYFPPSSEIRRQRRNHGRLVARTKRSGDSRTSQYWRAPLDFNPLSLDSFSAAVGRPNGVSNGFTSLQISILRRKINLSEVT